MLNEYKLISKEQYQDFWRKLNTLDYKKREPQPMDQIKLSEKNSKLFNKLKEQYIKEEISTSKISEVLGIDTLTARKLIKEWESINAGNISIR